MTRCKVCDGFASKGGPWNERAKAHERCLPVVWHYSIPSTNLEGWAQIFITSRGVFSTVSDWGNYGYVWTATGHDDVREFFVRDDWADHVDYFASKLEPGKAYDGEETEKAVRALLERCGRDSEAIDELLYDHDLSTEVGFARLIDNEDMGTKDVAAIYSCAKYTRSRQVEQFILKVMPKLTALIREQLEAERRVQP